jgi:hypothetical protein
MKLAVVGGRSNVPRWAWPVAVMAVGIAITVALLLLDGSEIAPVVPSEPTLAVTEPTVRGGDVIVLRIQAARYTWGVPTSLEEPRDREWKTVYYWRTWAGKDAETIEPFPADENAAFEDVGFFGDASFEIQIPNVEPGRYRIAKEFIRDGTGPIEERIITAAVQITVVP